MKIKLIYQKNKFGCGIACLAMVSKKSYDNVVQDFINDFNENGLETDTVIEWLGDNGFSILVKDIRCYNEKDFARAYMFKPFAEVHIVRVRNKVDTMNHLIVMDKKGKLFCPDGTSDEDLRHCYLIDLVIGLYPNP